MKIEEDRWSFGSFKQSWHGSHAPLIFLDRVAVLGVGTTKACALGFMGTNAMECEASPVLGTLFAFPSPSYVHMRAQPIIFQERKLVIIQTSTLIQVFEIK